MKILIIHNSKSGRYSNKVFIKEILSHFEQNEIIHFSEVSDLESMAKVKPLVADHDLIIIIGGDGTAAFYSNSLIESDRPVLVIPTGSGNDFSNSFGVTKDPQKIIKAVRKFNITKSSTILVNGEQRVLTILCFGFEARVNRLANKMPRFIGSWKYTIATLIALFGKHYESLHIQSDSMNESGDYSLAIIANSPSFGGGLRISNKASALDEKMYLILVNRVNKFKLIYLFLLLLMRKHYLRPEFREFEVTKLMVNKTDGVLRAQADGESLPEGTVNVKIDPHSLKVLQFE